MYMKFQNLIEKKNNSLKMISTLILDEADRMLDMDLNLNQMKLS